MKYAMVVMVSLVVGCAGERNRPPPNEPTSTTQTTSTALTTDDSMVSLQTPQVDSSSAPIIATRETDRGLGTKIKKQLEHDKELRSVAWQRVTIEVDDGSVTLRGDLPTVADSTEMERCVRGVKGVRSVTNSIHLPAGQHQ